MQLDNIRNLRKRLNYSQTDFGKIVGVHKTTYSRWETGEKIIPLKRLIPLCKHLNVSLDFALGFQKEKGVFHSNIVLDKKVIGRNIKELRKRFGLTQDKLAKSINTTQSTISSYEKGITTLLTAFLYDISKTYKVSADWICQDHSHKS